MDIKKPNRVTRSFIQRLVAGPERVFPLLCPVREADWIEGWDPVLVLSETGLAEPDCVFVTGSADQRAIWFISRHEPLRGEVEMLKIVPEVTACRLTICLKPASHGCDAAVTYAHTSLGPKGDAFVKDFTEDFYARFMRDWESRLNHYLRTGERLS